MRWPAVQVRRLFHVVNGGTPTADPVNWNGPIPWATPIDLGRRHGQILIETERTLTKAGLDTGSAVVPAGSLIVSTRAPIGYVAKTTTPTAFNQGCRGLAARSGLHVDYYRYALLALGQQLQAAGQGSTFVELSGGQLAELRVPSPPRPSQQAIADFLDAETARIDAIITKKRRLIELFEERFAAYLRNRLASLEPRLPLKRRWQVIDCKHRTPEYVDEGFPVVSPGDVTPGRLDLRRAHRFVDAADFEDLADPLRKPHRGDIIYSRNASIGLAAYVDTDQPFCMGQDVCLITSPDQDQLYLAYVLNSIGVDQLEMHKIGSTFSRVNVSQIVELDIPTPDPAIQRSLATQFDVRQRTSDASSRLLERQIALLQEHRQALITAAVTGELDIPGVAA